MEQHPQFEAFVEQHIATCIRETERTQRSNAVHQALQRGRAHDCLDHIRHREHEWTEGSGEHCYQEWYECSWPGCGQKFTPEELDREYSTRPVGERGEDEMERARR